MPRIRYVNKKFHGASLTIIETANAIIADYSAQGFTLTLRQLYYQFVARGLLPNSQRNYKNLGAIINDARLAGLMDWDGIEDRTRNLRARSSWGSPEEIIESAASSYHTDWWENQAHRLEVWIEKDALVGVIEGVCNEWDVPYFACRGYSSQSEQWRAGRRMARYVRDGQKVVVLHLGDHDPSGIDMTRDNEERLRMFMGAKPGMFKLQRLALNMDQVEQYNPPPNPAKLTDSRARGENGYIARFGDDSWELDALDPSVIVSTIETAIKEYVDDDDFNAAKAKEEKERRLLNYTADNMDRLQDDLDAQDEAEQEDD